MELVELLSAPFMVRALLVAAVTGIAAPTVGTFLVQRRLALLGDGMGHIAVTGVALGLLTSTSPTLTAIIVTVIGAVAIEVIRAGERVSGDVALALLFYGGIAGGLVLISFAGDGIISLQGYLFGSILTIAPADVWVTIVLAILVVSVCLSLTRPLFAVAYDEAFARTLGLSVGRYNLLIAVLAAVTVTVAMRTVGLLLVSALMVIPVATAQQFTRGFGSTMRTAMGLGLAAAIVGVVASALIDTPPGATIVLVALAAFAATAPIGLLVRLRRRMKQPFEMVDEPIATPVDAPHDHVHGPGCGHPAVVHGDHVDYLHDGQRHAAHGDHYDEH